MKTWGGCAQLIAIVLIAAYAGNTPAIGSFDHIKQQYQPSESLLLDRHGETLHRLRTNVQARRGVWVALDDVSPALRTALVLSEDQRFYEHSGVDWRAVGSAAWGNLKNERARGASTISMQLAGLLDEDLRQRSGGRSVGGKVAQAFSAQQIERRWSKAQILEAYLNLLPFRGELVGIDALSRSLFGKAAHGLDEQEASIAAALVRAPNASPQRVAERACGVLRRLQSDATDCTGLGLLVRSDLQRREFAPSAGVAPHLAQRLLKSAPPTVRSSLHAPLQRFALHSLQRHVRELQGRNVEDAALVVLDNASGEVLAYVGSSGGFSSASEVDGAQALRQAGSTLKPFLYAQAIAQKRLTAASLLDDSSAQIPTASGLYIPQNYDRSFKGWVSVRTALGASLNVPAVRALVMVSPTAFAQQLQAVGLSLKHRGEHYGYSLALGSADVSLLQLTNSYRTLANGGRTSAPSFTPGAKPVFQSALDPAAAFIVGDILSDSHARAMTFGSDSVLATRFWTAVKTGTSKDMRDNWAVGYSQHYTVGVWMGNASGAPMWDVSGTSGAAPIWADVMGYLHRDLPSRARPAPPGVYLAATQYAQGQEASRQEWYLADTQASSKAVGTINLIASHAGNTPAASQNDFKILSPSPGTIIALDPDIPPLRQRLSLRSNSPAGAPSNAQARWMLNGKELARGAQAAWLPWPGRHRITLHNAQGQQLDEVHIEVRGAGVKLARK